MKKRLLIEALLVTVMVWLLYGPLEVAAMGLFVAICIPFMLITATLLGAYKKRRRR